MGWLVGAADRKAMGGAMTAAARRTAKAAMMAAILVLGMTACSSEDTIAEEPTPQQPAQPTPQTATKIHVTVGAGISDGDGQTRSAVVKTEYMDYAEWKIKTTRTLTFTAGDKLYVWRSLDGGHVAGMLSVKNGTLTDDGQNATFEGDVTLYDAQGQAGGTMPSGDLLEGSTARLVHEGMTEGTDYSIDVQSKQLTFADATKVADDVATLMTTGLTVQGSYTAGTGYTLQASESILNIGICGLTATTAYQFVLKKDGNEAKSVTRTTDDSGTATFVLAISETGSAAWSLDIKQSSTTVGNISLGSGSMTLEAKVYNVGRYWTGTAFTKTIDLATINDDLTVTNGLTLTGELSGGHKVSIADGAKITLLNVTINATNGPGIECKGDATIILPWDELENSVTTSTLGRPAIYVPEDKTLTIQGEKGDGMLTATGAGEGAGIGGGHGDGYSHCGHIVISGGHIKATGDGGAPGIGSNGHGGNITITGGYVEAIGGDAGSGGAGIGSGYNCASCGDITITGGQVRAQGRHRAAGIGSGYSSSRCGDITISGEDTRIEAINGGDGAYSIGPGKGSSCGKITIGGTVYYDGTNFLNDGAKYLSGQSFP